MQLIARFTDDKVSNVTVEFVDDNEMIETKVISLDDFVDIITGSIERDANEIEIGKLPNGYYSGAINVRYNNSFRCTIVVPEGIFPVRYYDTNFTIPFPSLVFNFNVLKGKVVQARCFALKDVIPTDNSIIYRYPFGNVHSSNGNICWGSNNLETVNQMCDLNKIITLFYGSPTNDDLYSPGNNVLANKPYVATLRAFYSHLNGRKKFTKEVLNPFNMTLGELK